MNSSYRQQMQDAAMRRLEEVDADASKRMEEAEKILDRYRPKENSSQTKKIMLAFPIEGHECIETCARIWRVPVTAVCRFLVAEGLSNYGFRAHGVLSPKDWAALRRSDDANKPYQMKSEAERKSRDRGGKFRDVQTL